MFIRPCCKPTGESVFALALPQTLITVSSRRMTSILLLSDAAASHTLRPNGCAAAGPIRGAISFQHTLNTQGENETE